MVCGEILNRLKNLGVSHVTLNSWDLSQKDFPEGNIDFLQDSYIDEFNRYFMLSPEITGSFHEACQRIRSSEELKRLIWHFRYILFKADEKEEYVISDLKLLKAYLGDLYGMFNAILIYSRIGYTVEFYRERGIPEDILTDTMSDLEIWMRHFHKEEGLWGLDVVSWLLLHVNGRIFRLGRLQYVHGSFGYNARVYRNRKNGKIAALAEPGIKYRSDGEVDGTNDIFDSDAWTSVLEINDLQIKGNFITPRGKAIREPVTLPVSEWELVLAKGDPALEMHIPEGSKMDFELCGQSMKMALEFFPEYFPEKTFKTFTIGTWLLDAQLQDLLPADSNIVKFQREFYLLPLRSNHIPTYSRVFGRSDIDIATAPRNTALQRAIVDYVLSGGHMRYNAGFILPENMKNWGLGWYQTYCMNPTAD